MSKKATIIVSVIAVAIFVGAVVSVSYAYFINGISFDPNNKTGFTTADMVSPEFQGGAAVHATDLLPGDSFVKKFSVLNNGKESFSFKVIFKEVENTFVNKQDLVYYLYEVVSETEKTLLTGGADGVQVPDATSPLSDILTVPAKSSKSYELKITYKDADKDPNKDPEAEGRNQIEDSGKYITGKLFIEENAGN